MSFLFDNSRTISIDLDKLMCDIPTYMLEEELEERRDLQKNNPERAEKKEKLRSDTVDYEIDIRDYDLVDEEDLCLTNYDDVDLKQEIEHRGYTVLPDDDLLYHEYGVDGIAQGLTYLQPWRLKDFICDFLGISRLSNKEQIIDELKTKF